MQTRHRFLVATVGISLLLAAAPSRIVRVRIDHVSNAMRTRIALGPGEVEREASQTIESRDRAFVARLLRLLDDTPHAREARRADLRYAIRFEDAAGRTVRLVYLDAFGTRGTIDGLSVRFQNDDLKRALLDRYPSLAR